MVDNVVKNLSCLKTNKAPVISVIISDQSSTTIAILHSVLWNNNVLISFKK